MKTTTANVSICRTSSNKEKDFVSIDIADEVSRNIICSLKMSMESFANAILNLSNQKAEATVYSTENIGKKREVTEQFCEKVYNKEEQKKIVEDHFKYNDEDINGWFIFDDGTRSQQHGKYHRYVIARYIEVEDGN